MTKLRIQLLGPPQITLDERPISVDTRKAIALLGYLAVTQQPHRRSSLTVLFWPESDQKRGRTALRRTLAALNKAVGKEWIEADRTVIELKMERRESGELWIDVLTVRDFLAAVAQTEGQAEQMRLLQEAADLYHGRFMEGFGLSDSPDYDDWQFFEREQVNQDMTAVWSQLIEIYSKAKKYDAAISLARQWLALDPLLEQSQLTLMQLYAWSGQRTVALRQFEEYVNLLDEELGIEPQPETTAVYEQIRQNRLTEPQTAIEEKTDETIQEEAAMAAPPVHHNLPLIATPFVGREKEKNRIVARLTEPGCRLLTIIGPGGIGKTRLALETAVVSLPHFSHGVYFVPLADLSTSDHMGTLIADVVGFTFYRSKNIQEQLLAFLRDKSMLLILDNYEHILDDTSFVVTLMRSAPHIKLLVTSQERLNLREEWLYEIEAFSCLSEGNYKGSSAYRLFMQRAKQVNPHYTTAPGDVRCMVEICRFVGGLPLGIELAASWVRLFPPCDIVQEMQSSLDFLTSSLQDIPDRQRSLRAVFEYSWQLLTDQEQETFSRLAVFRGSFNIPAALKITKVSLSSLVTLVDKSLLRQTQHGRHEIPPVLQEYGRARLNAMAQRRHLEEQFASHYLEAVADLEASLKGSKQKEALQQMRIDLENVRQAWQWGVAHRRLNSLSVALPALLLFFEMRSAVQEGAALFAQAIEALRQDEHWRLLGRLQTVRGACLIRQGEQEAGQQLVALGIKAIRPFQDQPMLALGHFYLGISHDTEGDLEDAATFLRQSWQLFQQEKDRWGMANALNALGNVYLRQKAYDEAQQVYQESLMLRRNIGDQRGIAISYHNMGNVPVALGHHGEAQRYFEKSLEINRELNDRRGIGHALNNIGYTAYLLGHYARAEKYLHEGLTYLSNIGEQLGIAHVLQNLGHVALAREEWLEARQFYENSLLHFESIGDRLNTAEVKQDLQKVELHLLET